MNKIHLLSVAGMPILEQLKIEEALLRADDRCFCVINRGSSPAIVMGISGEVKELIDLDHLEKTPMEVIRRYSGGGTVVVDHNTLFVTFILNKPIIDAPLYPEKILGWSEGFYRKVFEKGDFRLIENDYAFSQKKFGGNAQYIKKDRFVHHTTFLWDYDPMKMKTLKMPKKRPKYREDRLHEEFICPMNRFYSSVDEIASSIEVALSSSFNLEHLSTKELEEIQKRPHRTATELIPWKE